MNSPEQTGDQQEQPKEESKMEGAGFEREQTPEEIKELIEKAFTEKLFCNLIIEQSNGPRTVDNLIVEKIEGDDLTMTYIAEDGGWGEEIPLNLKRIKKVVLG